MARSRRLLLCATVLAAACTLLVGVRADPVVAATSRLSGANRYETAAVLARSSFGRGVGVAFVVTGVDFPDALAAGPAAAKLGGPILLAQRDALPRATADVLRDLAPVDIVVVGGPNSVSDGVARQLDTFASGEVRRVHGANRYETAAALAGDAFGTASTVYLANGLKYPDALSGAPAAAKDGAPLLLTTADDLPSPTGDRIRQLGARTAIVLGGTGTVSDTVVNRLRSMGLTVDRWGGGDRAATSAIVAQKRYSSGVPVAYLATGYGYADALAAGPVAARAGGPILLVQANCIPASVDAVLDQLNPTDRVLLGGTSAVGPAVEGGTVCPSGAPARTPYVNPGAPPAWNDDGPDPQIVRFGSTWYAYTTGTTWGNNIGVLVSDRPDGGWRTTTGKPYGSTALGNIPSWQAPDSQWAPGVYRWGDTYVLFYAARVKAMSSPRYCLSVATSGSPTGPFTDRTTGPIICQSDGSIDPHPLIDASGQPWLYWKNNDEFSDTVSKVWAVKLGVDGVTTTGPHHEVMAKNSQQYPWQTTVDNPQMVLIDGHHYLFHTGGDYQGNDTYTMGYALCQGPTGPCTTDPTPLLRSYPGAAGPGGGTVAQDAAGQWWISYHAWPSGCSSYACGERRLFVAPMHFR